MAAIGNIITVADYNAIRTKVDSVLGDGDGAQTGYGRTLESSPVTAGAIIQSEQMQALYNDLVKARKHQKGLTNLAWPGDGLNSPSDEELIGVYAADIGTDPNDANNRTSFYATSDTDEGFDDFDSAADAIVTDHDLAHPTQLTVSAGSISTRTTQWGGNDVSLPGSSINHTVTVTWINADERRYFFNSGGEIRFDAVFDGSHTAGTKDAIWQQMVSSMGTVIFGKNSTASDPDATNPGSGTNIGNFYSNWSNTTSSNRVTIFTKSGTGVYADNYYTIQAWEPATNSLRFDIIFQDADLGEGGPLPDTPVDEFVTADLTSTLSLKTATGVLDIDVPGITTDSNLSGSSAGAVTISIDAQNTSGTSITEIDEGNTVNFVVSTTNIANGTQLSWDITGINGTDTTSLLSDVLTIQSNTATVSVPLIADETTDGEKTLVFTLNTGGGVSKSVTVNDTSGAITGTLYRSTNVVYEGDTVSFWMASGQTELEGNTFYWGIDDATLSQEFFESDGTFVYDSTQTYTAANPCFTVTLIEDNNLDDEYQTVNIVLRRGSPTATPLATRLLNLYNTTEDPFTVRIDTSTTYIPYGTAGVGITRDPLQMAFAYQSTTGNNDDIEFRIRGVSGDASNSYNPNNWYSTTSGGTGWTGMLIGVDVAGTFDVDFRGSGRILFGVETYFTLDGTFTGDSSTLHDHGGKVVDVRNWGRQFQFDSFKHMFQSCAITEFTDNSNPFANHSIGDISYMFADCNQFTGINSGLETWVVGNIVRSDGMFKNCTLFNGDISNWNTSNITNMDEMFMGAHLFNADISGWSVGNVLGMTSMFEMYANDNDRPPATQGSFNRDIGNWDVSNVVGFERMFYNNQGFDQSLLYWCVTNHPQEPTNFAGGLSILQTANNPQWGQCPTPGSISVALELQGAGGSGGGGWNNGIAGTAGGATSVSSTEISESAAGGSGGTVINGTSSAGESSFYGPGGAGGANSDSDNQSAGGNAPSTSYGAGGGGGGSNPFGSTAGQGGGAGDRVLKNYYITQTQTLTVTVGAGGPRGPSQGTEGGSGAGGYVKITVGSNTVYEYTSPGTYTISVTV
jgi:surface protein